MQLQFITSSKTRRIYLRLPAEERFWAKIDKNGPIPPHCSELGPCWLWTGALNIGGYGVFYMPKEGSPNGYNHWAHRFSWEIHHGSIAKGLHVLHHCDNPACSNPQHLFLGTDSDNHRDRGLKGRTATGDKHGTHTHPEAYQGENNGRAKLTRADITAIRESYESNASLGRQYSVTRDYIGKIKKGKAWA